MIQHKRAPILVYFVFAIFFVHSCALLQPTAELENQADAAWEAGNFEEAFGLYEQIIEAHQSREQAVDGVLLNRAGISAWESGETQKALEYLELARHTADADAATFATLAKAYREVDNLSREITNLERYVERFPDGPEVKALRNRLFMTLVESLNWQQAKDLWADLGGDPYQDEEMLTAYLQVNRALDDVEKSAAIAEQLLDLNRNNQEALDFLGRMHFDQAVSLYNREMRAYEQNRTHRQYAQLLEALEITNTDFRIALNYFERLYALDPKPEYATFLANIYERFQDEERARYYRQRAR